MAQDNAVSNKKVSQNTATQLAVMEGVSYEQEGVTTDSSNRLRRAFSFLLRQTEDIRRGGVTVLLRKAGRAISLAGLLPLLPVVVLIRVLRPLVLIRFGPLRSERIGHFAGNTELYLCERDAGMHVGGTVDIFYHTSPVCNRQLKKMWDRTLRVSRFAGWLDRLNRMVPGGEKHVIAMPSDRDINGLLGQTRTHLVFTPEEERQGRLGLQRLGVPEGAPFLCFCTRDPAYLNAVFPDGNWSYHDYRNSSIHNFVPAVEELARRGYFAIRMGAVVKEPLTTLNPKVIDYATNGSRTDFMDIYLSAKCRYFLLSPTGIENVPMIFRRPRAYVNFIPLEYVPAYDPKGLFIPKKLWLRKERRFLTFREILDSGTGRFLWSEQYEQNGIEVLENTREEITAVAVEMDERVKGTWETTEEDEDLQRRFWALFKPSELNKVFVSRIGAEFLRQNRELLE